MPIESLKILFNRDLNKLKSEIESYHKESDIWKIQEGIANSAGNICLHLVGNLNIYILELNLEKPDISETEHSNFH